MLLPNLSVTRTICRRRPARSPSFARTASVAAETVLIKLRLAVLLDVQVKAVVAVRKQQHIADRFPARSTMRFRYDLQTVAVTVDVARLDDD